MDGGVVDFGRIFFCVDQNGKVVEMEVKVSHSANAVFIFCDESLEISEGMFRELFECGFAYFSEMRRRRSGGLFELVELGDCFFNILGDFVDMFFFFLYDFFGDLICLLGGDKGIVFFVEFSLEGFFIV